MEHIHGIDVSWMSHGGKDKGRQVPRRRNTIQTPSSPPLVSSSPASPSSLSSPRSSSPLSSSVDNPNPLITAPPPGTKIQRRSSWFSNISSKFSTVPGAPPPQATNTSPKTTPKQTPDFPVPRANPSKNAVLQHAAKYEGEGPYIPAPPKSSPQTGFFQALRRLSTSSGNMSPTAKGSHGLVERRILNVDKERQRCALSELRPSKLRRVAFCVDVEIAPMPKYVDQAAVAAPKTEVDLVQKRKASEKGQGEALRHARTPSQELETLKENPKENEPSLPVAKPATKPESASLPKPAAIPTPVAVTPAAVVSTTTAAVPTITATANATNPLFPASSVQTTSIPIPTATPETKQAKAQAGEVLGTSPSAAVGPDGKPTADGNRKKEKKKKSEEERKARKERKRKLAESNGTVPLELHYDSEDSEFEAPSKTPASPPPARGQMLPTTNPVRIYRRCCQLRETPILKKIVEKLSEPTLHTGDGGVVTKLDLTGYWMQLADLATLGDFLAIVPVRELVLDNCGLTDEGLRAILGGLLAAKNPVGRHVHHHRHKHGRSPSESPDGKSSPVDRVQGGFVERLVLKNNKFGVEGWKHVCLFLNMCLTLKALDMSKVAIPQPPSTTKPAISCVARLLGKSIGNRLGGATLELLNFGDTGLTADGIGLLIDGVIECGIKRLGIANNDLDAAGIAHVARYISSGKCESLDLGGNDLCDNLERLADVVGTSESLWALSVADCSLKPTSLTKLLPQLTKLHNFRFLDLSHNHDLFQSNPSVTPLLRRYLPQMDSLKRLHLADVAMSAEQAIAIAEIIPEVKELAHINILQNPQLSKLADARTEEAQEQACALYASLLAATRISPSIIAVDMEMPTAESTEIVRGMAKQVLAYCLRNVDRVTSRNAGAIGSDALSLPKLEEEDRITANEIEYPKVIQHLVGHDVSVLDEVDDEGIAPDDDYVIGGTGVAQALECCLKNRGSDSNRASGEFEREDDGSEAPAMAGKVPGASKAKDMSKHLLLSARKIRLRLQPALQKAKVVSGEHTTTYQRLLFLDQTLDGIIKRFEDEFPETRVSIDSGVSVSPPLSRESSGHRAPSINLSDEGEAGSTGEVGEREAAAAMASDGEDETEVRPSGLTRSSSSISLSAKGLTNEEGRALRAGHRFRSGWFKHYSLLAGAEDIEPDQRHKQMLVELLNEVNDAALNQKVAEKGIVRVFNEDRQEILQVLRAQDPEHWDRFAESQQKARANLKIELDDGRTEIQNMAGRGSMDEQAIDDDDEESS